MSSVGAENSTYRWVCEKAVVEAEQGIGGKAASEQRCSKGGLQGERELARYLEMEKGNPERGRGL